LLWLHPRRPAWKQLYSTWQQKSSPSEYTRSQAALLLRQTVENMTEESDQKTHVLPLSKQISTTPSHEASAAETFKCVSVERLAVLPHFREVPNLIHNRKPVILLRISWFSQDRPCKAAMMHLQHYRQGNLLPHLFPLQTVKHSPYSNSIQICKDLNIGKYKVL
jgi:predicted  nucleic acid-binding Zn ribbon protein